MFQLDVLRISSIAVKPVHENELYGYKWVEEDEEEESWCRVLVSNLFSSPQHSSSGSRAIKRPVKKMASIYFPDYGNTIEVDADELLELPKEFYSLPFQVNN